MVFVVLIGGILAVRLLAALLCDRHRAVRAVIPTALGVGIGLLALHIMLGDMEF